MYKRPTTFFFFLDPNKEKKEKEMERSKTLPTKPSNGMTPEELARYKMTLISFKRKREEEKAAVLHPNRDELPRKKLIMDEVDAIDFHEVASRTTVM